MTNALILAAGAGTRLGKFTEENPKCMVEYFGKKIIDWELDALRGSEIEKIAVVSGYRSDVLKKYLENRSAVFFENENYASTNMVASLFCAHKFLESCIENKSDLIISYADIVYTKDIVQKLLSSTGNISIVIDDKWKVLWEARFENPLSDAETLKIQNGKIVELGKKPADYSEIQAQYMGLFKFSHIFLPSVLDFYDTLPRTQYDGRSFDNMFMTTFLQLLIDKFGAAVPVHINGGWAEVDSPKDLEIDFQNFV